MLDRDVGFSLGVSEVVQGLGLIFTSTTLALKTERIVSFPRELREVQNSSS